VEELYQDGVVNWPPLIGPRQNNLEPSPRLLSRTPHFISTPSAPPSDPIYESLQFELCCLPKNPRSPLGCEELVIGIGQSDTRATRTSSKWTARRLCSKLADPRRSFPTTPTFHSRRDQIFGPIFVLILRYRGAKCKKSAR
jgi:hypothetical protein